MLIARLQTNTPLDKLLNGGIEIGAVTNIYGPAGTGKTNIALAAAINCKRKIIYIDTEGSFSSERFSQLGGTKEQLKNMIFFEPHSWEEQHEAVKKLEDIVKKGDIDLIVIDSMVTLYRLELDQQNFSLINKQLATQYSILSKIGRKYKIAVLVTNQVYGLLNKEGKGEIELTSRAIAKYWAKALIELKKTGKDNQRLAVIRKHRSLPEGQKIEFEITQDKIKPTGKFGIFK
jgi:DNA repair protein RadB